MKIVYASRTGNVQSFIEKTGFKDLLEISSGNEIVEDQYVLVTYTDGYGEVPQEVNDFLENNASLLVAVAASGDKGYGEAYCQSADVISNTYNVPIILKFEFDGTEEEVSKFVEEVNKLA